MAGNVGPGLAVSYILASQKAMRESCDTLLTGFITGFASCFAVSSRASSSGHSDATCY